jgi:LacI family transcriptional regulator
VRVALHIVQQRRKRLRSLIRAEGFLPLAAVCRRLGVSEATARRDLAAVAAKGHITRTRGGGLMNHGSPLPARAPGIGGDPRQGTCAGPDGKGPESLCAAPSLLRTTLRDIAAKTGFAKTTVSLSLRNNPKIPEVTRQLVRAAARELDYRPDPALARIAEHRWRTRTTHTGSTVAFVTMANPPAGDSPDSQAIGGARNRAKELGYGFEQFRLENYSNAARLGSVLFHRGIRGVVVGQVSQADFCGQFPWGQFSAVGCNVGPFRPPISVVVPDDAHAMIQAWRRAADHGHRLIGVALAEEGRPMREFDRICAALHCQSDLPPGEPRVPVLRLQPGDRDGFLRWMRKHGPEAVVGSDEVFFRWIREAGFGIPRELGFVSLAVNPGSGSEPRIAGMDCNAGMIGQAAVEQLDILIRTNQIGPPSRPFALMVESSWVPGDTLGDSGDRLPCRADREVSPVSAAGE